MSNDYQMTATTNVSSESLARATGRCDIREIPRRVIDAVAQNMPFITATVLATGQPVFAPWLAAACATQDDVNLFGYVVAGPSWAAVSLPWLPYLPVVVTAMYLALMLESRIRYGYDSDRETSGHLNRLCWLSAALIGLSVNFHINGIVFRYVVGQPGFDLPSIGATPYFRAIYPLFPCAIIGIWTLVARNRRHAYRKHGGFTLTHRLASQKPLLFWFLLSLSYCASPVLLALIVVCGTLVFLGIFVGAVLVIAFVMMLLILPIAIFEALKHSC